MESHHISCRARQQQARGPAWHSQANVVCCWTFSRDGLQAAQYAASVQKLIPQLGYLSKILPPAVLQWKLELLKQGNAVVKGMLPRIQQRVFLLAADGDLLIPSKEEGPRLQKLLPRCRLKVLLYGMQLPAAGIVMWWCWHCF